MTKEKNFLNTINQRLLDCRLIADEICTETLLLPNAEERFELNRYAKKVLYDIDYFLSCLRNMGVEVDAE